VTHSMISNKSFTCCNFIAFTITITSHDKLAYVFNWSQSLFSIRMFLATLMLVDVTSASMSNGKMDVKMLAYHFCSITTQLVQFNKIEFFPEIVLKTAVSRLWHCKDRLKALKIGLKTSKKYEI
jgi:hypothetical protein